MGLFSRTPNVLPRPIRTRDAWLSGVVDAELPTILEVYSDSCPPCRRLVPVLTKVATRYADEVQVVTVGTDAELELLRELQVRSTPTLIIYKDGAELGRMTGFRPFGWFEEMIAAELRDA